MLTILIAIIVALILTFALDWPGTGAVVIVIGFILGLFVPLGGYKEPIKEEIQLLSLTEEADRQYYLVKESDQKYLYKINKKYENSEEKYYDIETLNSSSIELIEKEKCKNPVIHIYNFTPKIGPFTFALGSNYKEYVIYVPEGSIIE